MNWYSVDWEKAIFFVLGVVATLATFEVTERRKARIAHRELRQALTAELEHVEVTLSGIIGKLAYLATTPTEIAAVAEEIRWFVKTGRLRLIETGVLAGPSEIPSSAFLQLDDAQMISNFAALPTKATGGTRLIVPVIDAVLAGRTVGFKSREIQALSVVKWQAYVLEQQAVSTEKFFDMTFTITDPQNHGIVVENHRLQLQAYAARVAILLRCVRSALFALGVRPSPRP